MILNDSSSRIFVESIGDIAPAEVYHKLNFDTRSEIAVPLIDGHDLLGVLNIEDTTRGAFSEDDRILLETLAVSAIIGFHTVSLYKRLEYRIRNLTSLNLIAARVQHYLDEPDTICRLFLTGITARAGLSFSRAMVFFADEHNQYLNGEAAIGPLTQEYSQSSWQFPRETPLSPDSLASLLAQTEDFCEQVKAGILCEYSPLGSAVRGVSLPIEESAGVTRTMHTVRQNSPLWPMISRTLLERY